MAKVLGVGGVFFKSRDPVALAAWYKTHLGLNVEDWGGVAFRWAERKADHLDAATIWSPFKADTQYFAPSSASFMINYVVDDVRALVAKLKSEGCQADDKIEDSDYGTFGWVVDPDGNKLELWQPPAKK